MAKNPAFPLYAQDFLVDVAEWTAEEVGVYIRLLSVQWINGDLSSDPNRLTISGGPEVGKVWPVVSAKFKKLEGGRMVNERLEEIRAEKSFFLKSQSEAGKRGAAKRWGKGGQAIADPISNPNSESVAFKNEEEEEIEEEEVVDKEGVQGEGKKQKRKNPAEKPGASEYTKAMDYYDKFIRTQTGNPAKIDAVEGSALKKILDYFGKLEDVQNGRFKPSDCLNIVFDNWDRLDTFQAGQLKLVQINSNLINIISRIKNGQTDARQQRGNLTTAAEFFRAQKMAGN